MCVNEDFDNRLYCCMGELGSIIKKNMNLLSETRTQTVFNPPYDALCEGEYVEFNCKNKHLALVGWSCGWVCLYYLPDCNPINTWDISSFNNIKQAKSKNISIKKICWSHSNENVFFVLDNTGKILIFDLKYSQLVYICLYLYRNLNIFIKRHRIILLQWM